jgi:hypothetical protein
MKSMCSPQRMLALGCTALCSLLIFSLTLSQWQSAAQAQAAPQELFIAADVTRDSLLPLPPASEALPLPVGTQRSRNVSIDPAALASVTGDATSVSLNLFDDVRLRASSLRRDTRGVGTASASEVWVGEVTDVAYSNVVLLIAPSRDISLQVLIPGMNYTVQPVGGGQYRITEIDTYLQRGYDDAIIIQPDAAQSPQVYDRMNSPRADSGDVIDVMVVYTPQAAAFFGGQSSMQLAIEHTVALTNKTYENSDVNFRIRLVHTAQVNYDEQPFQDLGRLADPLDGYMDEVHLLRNQYAADLVALIAGNSAAERGYCGIAFLPTTLPAPDAAFSVTEALCISDITFAHELGHTMGKAHDRANAGGAVHDYAYGYQDLADPPGEDWGDFVTVMAYSDGGQCPPVFQPGVCPAIAWWSNPNMMYNGKPLGTADENNALSLNQTALVIANYRLSADGSPTATPSPTASATSTPVATEVEPTPTSNGAQQWVLNGGFEIDADQDRIPDGWSAVGAKQKCDSLNCIAVLKGGSGTSAKIQQSMTLSAPASGTLTASLRSGGKKMDQPGKIVIRMSYIDPALAVDKLLFDVPMGTTPLMLQMKTFVILSAPQALKITAKYGGSSGKMLVDDVQVITSP